VIVDTLVPAVTLSAPKRHTSVLSAHPGSWCDPALRVLMNEHICFWNGCPAFIPHCRAKKCSERSELSEDREIRNDTGLL
ncbi:MAG TPA: hypothetical protein PKX39_13535, partial [Flavobacteriales bacterium]|nr:hypothetical protein [Flavobacteriales bacterium]